MLKLDMLKILKAFKYAFQGIIHGIKFEFSFRIEFFLTLFLIPCAFLLGENKVEIILLSSSTLLILVVELLNTSLERTLDRYNKGENKLTKIAKDLASAAVLISLVIWLITWSLILAF